MPQTYKRDSNGIRFALKGGMNTVKAVDALAEGEYAYIQNCRAYLQDRITGRATQAAATATTSTYPVHSIRCLNDSTTLGPVSGYSLVIGAAGAMYVNSTQIATGFSGNPVSLIPFRPNTSVQPWMYVGDSSDTATINTGSFSTPGMLKVRSDGLTYKWGIAEPQAAPVISTANTSTTGTDSLPATTIPWTNVGGVNTAYNYGHTSGTDGTSPVIVATPIYGSTVTITVTGSATVNGVTHAPGNTGSTSSGYPGNFIPGADIVVGAFTDASGNVVALPAIGPVNIGASKTLTVPTGAVQLQIGINSSGNTFNSNSGSFSVNWSVTTSAIATAVSTLGNVTAYYWGDSPHSGPVASYIWRNPNDTGTGTPRTTGTAAGSVTNNSWNFDSTPEDDTVPVQWNTLDSTGAVVGSVVLFSPALESQGYQDFNACIVGTLFIPAAGTYSFTFKNKDQIMVGVGGGATVSGGAVTGPNGQTISVVNSLPLVYVSVANGSGGAVTHTLSITFPGTGAYQVEVDWDYWYHTGRSMIMTVNGAAIPPLPTGVRTNVSYAYKYRSSLTGAQSNPSPYSIPQATPVLDNTITPIFSPDPQVDKVDYYRQDEGMANYTYVASGPNTNPPTPITDALTDLAAATNQIMALDDFEPFPSIDLPKSGVVNVTGGIINWVSGDKFNVRWLAGTIMLIGSPTQLAYPFVARPTSVTSVAIPGVPDGSNLAYNIAQPVLAAQPLPSLWGPTDNTAYMFGCYDPLRPGTLYYTKGNNPDSAPDTNQIEVTSPSEPLMNGCVVNGIGMVFSSERAWTIFPTFSTALATVSGVSGQAFNLIESITNRGLYIRPCICTEAGKNIFFRAKDGIYVSPGGSGSQSISDAIFNLFPHEGYLPSPVVRAAYTIHPPDDTQPEKQRLAFATGYLYYDYMGTDGSYHTLVYDVAAGGWSVDIYGTLVSVHALEEGEGVNGVLTGCIDGTVRALANGATESATSVVLTGANSFGDLRSSTRIGDIFIKAFPSAAIAVGIYLDLLQTTLSSGYSPTSLAAGSTVTPYIIDFTSGQAQDATDLALGLSWSTQSTSYLDLWQPSVYDLPESTQDRPTDWNDCGSVGNKFVQGLLLQADSFNVAKKFSVQRSDDLAIFTPNEVGTTGVVFNGQSVKVFTFTPPFLAHSLRIVTTDGVAWRGAGQWQMEFVTKAYPEAALVWTTEGSTNSLNGYQHVWQINLAYISTQPVTLAATTDQGAFTVTWPATSTASLLPAKIMMKMPASKFKIISYSFSSTVPFYIFKNETETWCKQWDAQTAYIQAKLFGGASSTLSQFGAAVSGGAEI